LLLVFACRNGNGSASVLFAAVSSVQPWQYSQTLPVRADVGLGRRARSDVEPYGSPSEQANGQDHDEAEDWPHGNSDGGSVGGSHGGSDGAGGGAPYVEANGASHIGSDCASHASGPNQRIGDSIIVGGIDGSLAPSAREYARALISYLQSDPTLSE
jgi:hypothetical protein